MTVRCMLGRLLDLVEDEVVHHVRVMVDDGWSPEMADEAIRDYLAVVCESAVDRALAEQLWEHS
jgi:hypothetical protein